MEKVTQRSVAESAGIKAYFLNHILHARKPCPPSLAPKLEKLTGIDRRVWVWGSREKKQAAWDQFIKSAGERVSAVEIARQSEQQMNSGQRLQSSDP